MIEKQSIRQQQLFIELERSFIFEPLWGSGT